MFNAGPARSSPWRSPVSPSAGFPLTLELAPNLLPKPSWVKISQVRTLSVERLGATIGRLSPEDLDLLVEGLNEILAP